MHGEYIEERNGGYYLAGTRISLDSVVRYRPSTVASPSEQILESYPPLSRAVWRGSTALSPFTSIIKPASTNTWRRALASSRPTRFRCLKPTPLFGKSLSAPTPR